VLLQVEDPEVALPEVRGEAALACRAERAGDLDQAEALVDFAGPSFDQEVAEHYHALPEDRAEGASVFQADQAGDLDDFAGPSFDQEVAEHYHALPEDRAEGASVFQADQAGDLDDFAGPSFDPEVVGHQGVRAFHQGGLVDLRAFRRGVHPYHQEPPLVLTHLGDD